MTAQTPGQAAIVRVRKRPVEVEAIRWTGDNVDEVYELTGCDSFDVLDEQDRLNCDDPEATASVFDKLHSTWVLVYTGQWVIKGIRGEFYPCADDVFRETYDAAAQERPALQAREIAYLYHWRFERGEEFGLYRHAADADAQAAKHAGEGLSEVISMAILGDRPDPRPAPGLAARKLAITLNALQRIDRTRRTVVDQGALWDIAQQAIDEITELDL